VAVLAVLVAASAVSASQAKTKRVSVSTGGTEAAMDVHDPVISANGRWVVFDSRADTLVANDVNGMADIFVRDRKSKKTKRASIKSSGAELNAESTNAAISGNGRFVAFDTAATNLAGPTVSPRDVYVHDRKTKKTKRASRRPNGKKPNGPSETPDINGNGRFVVFSSNASNIVKNDTNGTWDIFVYDRVTKKTRRVSVKSNGKQANGPSRQPSISADGRFVAFVSEAKNLVKADTSPIKDVFVYDRKTRKTTRVSVRSNGAEAHSFSLNPRLSGNGRFVAFDSFAMNLVKNDTNGKYDVFVHDRVTKKTRRVSLRSNGAQSDGDSSGPDISVSGRYVAFHSRGSNLVNGDSNGTSDVFVHDRKSKKTKRVSVSTAGVEADDNSNSAAIDASGRAIAFVSAATNLIPNDTNDVKDVFYRAPLR
jgi:Tol biopolymer transport system component